MCENQGRRRGRATTLRYCASMRGFLRLEGWVCCLRAILEVDGGRVQRKYFRNAPFFCTQCQGKLINLRHCRHHNLSIYWSRRLRRQENAVLDRGTIFDLKCLRSDAVATSFLNYDHFDNCIKVDNQKKVLDVFHYSSADKLAQVAANIPVKANRILISVHMCVYKLIVNIGAHVLAFDCTKMRHTFSWLLILVRLAVQLADITYAPVLIFHLAAKAANQPCHRIRIKKKPCC